MSIYIDQDRSQDHDHQDVIEAAPSRTHRDLELHLEDTAAMECEAGQGITLVDEMAIADDAARVTVATAVTMTEAEAPVVPQADVKRWISVCLQLMYLDDLFSALAFGSGGC